ncbi:helix-turn-helix domain-containing protein [Leuconostoc palmae]|uniref:helix-turn-helix domain-containing protein n=1 Tax=Leuconostoc palmae TaxID=501487 RepID=UPI001C7D55D9|nr:helix-turn-helix transcriptional regulator [Leuconostoc palmae]
MKDKIFYSGVNAIYPDIASLDLQISTNMVNVAFDRERLEEIRRSRNISVNNMAKRIGLSRSRYYRWLDNEIDLPMDLLISMQKLLVLTDYEFLSLFGQPNDEYIQVTAMLAYNALLLTEDNCLVLRDNLVKHQNSSLKNDPYLLLLDFSNLCIFYVKEDCDDEFNQLFDHLINLIFIRDIWTTIDALVLVTMAYMSPKRVFPFFSELLNILGNLKFTISSKHRFFLIFDLFCIAVNADNKKLSFESFQKLNMVSYGVNDWKMSFVNEMSHIMIDNWDDRDNAVIKLKKLVNNILFLNDKNFEEKVNHLINNYSK